MNNVGRKVIGYIRATPGGAKGADKSAEDQEEELKAYAETEGLEFRNRSQILLLMLLCGEDVSSGYSNLGVRCQVSGERKTGNPIFSQ